MRYRLTFVACLGILLASGCVYQGGYPYGYYNGNYGGNYGAGPSVLPPGQWGYPTTPSTSPYYQPGVTPYTVPGGTVPGGNPTPIDGTTPGTTPGGTNPPWNNTNPPQTYDGGAGNAPVFNPNTPTGGNVPDPNDDTNGRSPGAQRPSLTPTSGASTRMRSSSQDDLDTPFQQDETNRPQQNVESESVAENEAPYEAPLVRQISNTEEFEAQPASQLTRTTGDAKSPYGRDPKFQWIKGVLDYDEANKAYVVMYDDNPSPSDQLGGELTLGDHQALDRFRPNDAVRIEGYFDQRDKDANGKPVYVITGIKKQ